VLLLINRQRTAAGLAPLQTDAALTRAAQAWARTMAATGVFGHEGPGGSMPASRIAAAGYRGTVVGEILARDFDTASEVFASWMSSALHRANILDADFSEIGIGVANGPAGTCWVLNFGGGAPSVDSRLRRNPYPGRHSRPGTLSGAGAAPARRRS
jgi:uncharacterized protein YkwD